MANKLYKTADEAIEEINNRVDYITTLIPSEILEGRTGWVIEENQREAIEAAEADRESKYPSFDRIVSHFGHGCSLRSVVKKARKIGKLNPKLEQLFNDSVAL